MKPGDLEYQALVEKKRAEIRGNVSSIKMTEAETAKEIAEVTKGIFEREEGNKVDSDKFRAELKALGPPPLQPKRRGRPKGSRNKPKLPAI